jgi:competence protein ComEA
MENQYFEKVSTWWGELHYTSIQKKGLAIIAMLVVAISALFVTRGSSQEVIAAPVEFETPAVSQSLIIDVAGAVKKPGVYSLPANSRVVDAIRMAGGLRISADTSDINQARLLKDGEQIYVYPNSPSSSYSSGGSTRAKRAPVRAAGPVLINRATAKEFESLDGIGPVLASRIVSYRKTNGAFTAIEDLKKVPGIGEITFAKFKEKLRV